MAFHFNGYPDFVAKLAKPGERILPNINPESCDLLHASLGIAGEAGEIVDAVKKHVIYGQPLNVENLKEEIGDLKFYLEQMMQIINTDDEECQNLNIKKLLKRYPNGYSDAAAKERLDKVSDHSEHSERNE